MSKPRFALDSAVYSVTQEETDRGLNALTEAFDKKQEKGNTNASNNAVVK